MTGKELVLYIIENDLLNEEVIKDGKIVGFITVSEAAVKYKVGLSTIAIWTRTGIIPSVKIGDHVYVPANAKVKIRP